MRNDRIFVLLPRNADADEWRLRYAKGLVPDLSPYGYHFAQEFGKEVHFSRTTADWPGVFALLDKAIKKLLGFDFRHAWHNRQCLDKNQYESIWTHTEYEHLAISAVLHLIRKHKPVLIGTSVWLCDEWTHFSALRKKIYRYLLSKLDIAAFESRVNTIYANEHGIVSNAVFMPFGISLDSFPIQAPRTRFASKDKIKVLALGNDRHRDWPLFFKAFADIDTFEVRIGSSKVPLGLANSAHNIKVTSLTQAEVRAAYEWADCLVLPLKDNMHASGLTSSLEAVALGLPVVLTLAGGLDAYFDQDALWYTPLGSATDLRHTVQALAAAPELALNKAIVAQQQLRDKELDTRNYAKRHVELTNMLLSKTSPSI